MIAVVQALDLEHGELLAESALEVGLVNVTFREVVELLVRRNCVSKCVLRSSTVDDQWGAPVACQGCSPCRRLPETRNLFFR